MLDWRCMRTRETVWQSRVKAATIFAASSFPLPPGAGFASLGKAVSTTCLDKAKLQSFQIVPFVQMRSAVPKLSAENRVGRLLQWKAGAQNAWLAARLRVPSRKDKREGDGDRGGKLPCPRLAAGQPEMEAFSELQLAPATQRIPAISHT